MKKKQSRTAGLGIQSFFVQNHKTETQKKESILYSQSKNTYDSERIFILALPQEVQGILLLSMLILSTS